MKYQTVLIFSMLLAGCASQPASTSATTASAATQVLTVTVGPELRDCVGVGPMRCLVVDNGLFYDPIQGFEHQSGYEYQLRILRRPRFNSEQIPADASRYQYQLLEVLSKQYQD